LLVYLRRENPWGFLRALYALCRSYVISSTLTKLLAYANIASNFEGVASQSCLMFPCAGGATLEQP
jgi:hypothetical protein